MRTFCLGRRAREPIALRGPTAALGLPGNIGMPFAGIKVATGASLGGAGCCRRRPAPSIERGDACAAAAVPAPAEARGCAGGAIEVARGFTGDIR